MKHNAFRWIPAVLLAALLAGCGAETAVPADAAAKPADSKQSAALTAAPAEPDSMMEPETVPETENAENAETPRITEQISLEKQCSAGYTTISVHLPKLESDSADAARRHSGGGLLHMGFHMVRRLRQHRSDERRPCMGRTISLVF